MGQAVCFVLLLLCAGRALAQLPIRTKFLQDSKDDQLREDQRRGDAFNLHDVPEDVASVAPIAIGCTARGSDFKATLLQKGAGPHAPVRVRVRGRRSGRPPPPPPPPARRRTHPHPRAGLPLPG